MPVPKEDLQLVCVTAMLIASKYEERYPPTVGDFTFVTHDTYTCEDVRRMERIILEKLNYSLGKPVAPHFLHRACKVGQVRYAIRTHLNRFSSSCITTGYKMGTRSLHM